MCKSVTILMWCIWVILHEGLYLEPGHVTLVVTTMLYGIVACLIYGMRAELMHACVC